MTHFHCDRCGRLFGADDRFMTANVDVDAADERETIEQVLLCGSCTETVGDSLVLDTTEYGRG